MCYRYLPHTFSRFQNLERPPSTRGDTVLARSTEKSRATSKCKKGHGTSAKRREISSDLQVQEGKWYWREALRNLERSLSAGMYFSEFQYKNSGFCKGNLSNCIISEKFPFGAKKNIPTYFIHTTLSVTYQSYGSQVARAPPSLILCTGAM